jgi:hypothetical protein
VNSSRSPDPLCNVTTLTYTLPGIIHTITMPDMIVFWIADPEASDGFRLKMDSAKAIFYLPELRKTG